MEVLNGSRITNTSIIRSAAIPLCDISLDFITLVNFVVNCILIPIVSIFGILGNVATIMILTYNGLNESTNIILTALAVSDLFYSATQILYNLSQIVRLYSICFSSAIYAYYVAYLSVWKQCAVCISVYMATLIVVERMVAVCFPTLLTPCRIKLTIIVITICVSTLYIPRSFCV